MPRGHGFCWGRLELLLAVAVGVLLIQLGMVVADWHRGRSRPGMQTTAQCLIDVEFQGEKRTIKTEYLVYLPVDYGESSSKWPLLVYLHGSGTRGSDIKRVKRDGPAKLAEKGRDFPFVLVSPLCPAKTRWEVERIMSLIEHVVERFRVDESQIYLTGYSMSGLGTWAAALAKPDCFAAIIPVAGGVSFGRAHRLRDLPVWAFHGARDEVIPVQSSEDMSEAVRAAGGNVKLTIYPDLGHDICEWGAPQNLIHVL